MGRIGAGGVPHVDDGDDVGPVGLVDAGDTPAWKMAARHATSDAHLSGIRQILLPGSLIQLPGKPPQLSDKSV
jgi:hypothetical protein